MRRNHRSLLLLTIAALALEVLSSPASAIEPCSRRLPTRGLAGPDDGPRRVCSPSESRVDRSPVASPAIEGPITSARPPFVAGTTFDLALVGYEQAEFFISGTASAYVNVNTFESDGRWTATPGATAPYKTRIIVYRPIDRAHFNGTVAVEWLNVSGGLDSAPDWITTHTEMIREGYVWVGVSAQKVGVEGGDAILGESQAGLKQLDPVRYGTLSHPGDSFSYDIYSQAAKAVLDPDGPDPLDGLRVERILAVGESQSAFRLVTYVNAIDRLTRLFDGYYVHSRGGGGAPLSQAPQAAINVSEVARIRSDVRVPVMTFQTETDLLTLGFLPDRQPDGHRFRLWEAAGTAHADTYTLGIGFGDLGDSPAAANVILTSEPIPGIISCGSPVNSGPQHWVANAALAALERWVRHGTPPPRAPRIEVAGSPADLVRDEHGNVLGGIRTPYVDAPIATLSGYGQTGGGFCGIFGTTVLFDEAKLASLYPSHGAYVAAVERSTDRAVRAGFILEPDAELIKAAAEQSDIGG